MPNTIIYSVDAEDTIRAVNANWDRFASENDAEHLIASAVIGSPLLDHITDHTTREVYRAILRRVRDGAAARFRLRCDAPTRRRLLEIEITREPDGHIEFRSREVAGAERGPRRLLDASAWRNDEFIRVCSWCNRIEIDGAWYELDDGVARARLFEQALLPRISHTCCEPCEATLSASLDSILDPITFSVGDEPFG